ncbi:polysaccharide biosynthesis tyrosine autokinase [Pleurocapsa sp. PCC 7319]|uniref:GumC family protein n=1 Tax=Pleurocapsa sp. PCC 7319 TaxID=118161 RepID=UPI00036E6228|nr:polysaccharide biosynthesis tyrosine autokinase [Pleurocapsa sp. PCC 7319]
MTSNAHLDEYIDFQKYWLVLKRRWIPSIGIFLGVVGFSLVYALSLDRIYEAEAKLLIKVDRSAKLTGLENGTGEIKGLTTDSNPLSTEAEIIQSRPVLKKLIQKLDLRDDDGQLLRSRNLEEAVKVKPITGTDILEITYTNKDPGFAALVVNKLIELYVEDHTLNNRSETASARDFIDKQLPEVEANVKKAEANLRDFKNQNRIASLEEETTANINSLSNVSHQIDEVEAELENVNARYSWLQVQLNMSRQEASAVSALSQSLAVQRVLEQLQEVKVLLAQRQNYLSDNAPQVITLKEEEADLAALLDRHIAQTLGQGQQAIVENINILSLGELKQDQIAEFTNLGLQKEGLEKQLKTLKNTYESHKQKSDTLPRLQEQKRELERRVNAAQSTYQTLLDKLQETQIAEQQNVGNVRVVSEADIPEDPVGPRKKMIVGGAGVAGALLSVGAAFLIDIRDQTIKNTQEIKAIFPYSLTGEVPDLNKFEASELLLLPDSSTVNLPRIAARNISVLPIREAYHNIQLNLKLLDNEVANKVIVVTSAVSGEGKSFVSANLAVAQAQCDQRVLLIDGDLRRPTQHNLWEVSNDEGLTNVLREEIEWHHAIQKVMPNLDLITSGTTSKHPISLLNSLLIKTFIADLSDYYDCIIFDTPPLVGLADSKILGKLADGLLLIVRPGVANYNSVAAATELLGDRDFNLLGVVANGVDISQELHSHSYYYQDQKYLDATV